MSTLDLALVGGTVATSDGVSRRDIGVRDGKVAVIAAPGQLPPAVETINLRDQYVLPGLVDPHTHPGNFRSVCDDIPPETRSAAVGGVTTIVATVKSPRLVASDQVESVGSYLDGFEAARESIESAAHVDVAFSFVIMTAQHAGEIPAYAEQCGVRSFKFFLLCPPISEWGRRVGMPVFPDEGTVFRGFQACAETGSLAMVHAENRQITEALAAAASADVSGVADWEARFPGMLEASEIRKAAVFSRLTGAPLYVVHVSSIEGLDAVDAARHEGTAVIAETCPQYTTLSIEDHGDLGARVKFNPPIRYRRDAAALWEGLASERIQCVGSDHVPGDSGRDKQLDQGVGRALPGSPGLATLLPLLWTHGVEPGRIGVQRLVAIACTNPAKAFGLYPRKGELAPGSDADMVVIDPGVRRTVRASDLHSWANWTAYEGMELAGWPTLTLLRGAVVARAGLPEGRASGRYLARNRDGRRTN